jgi:nucleoside-diphosphate-sugar epimerase
MRLNKKILVTGANGFTGSNLCRKLVEQGNHVKALVRPQSKLHTLDGIDVEFVQGDLSDGSLPREAFHGVDVVYHIAAAFRKEGVPRKYFYEVNTLGTQRVLEAALKADVQRFVHCSTIGVLGNIKNPPGTEETPYNPGDIYQETKMEGEKVALEFFQKHQFPGVVVRPGSIYGPGDTRFVKLFKSINRGVFVIIGSGETHFHMVYIEDLTDGMILASEKEEATGEVFILTGNEPVKINDLVSCIADVLERPVPKRHIPVAPVMLAANIVQKVCVPLGIEPPLYPRRLDFFVKDRQFDISKARNLLGYSPKVDLRTGLKATAEWYRENNLL